MQGAVLGALFTLPAVAIAKEYQAPPSSSGMSAAYISDEAMERCIIMYNQMLDLERQLSEDSRTLDLYNQSAVNAYNQRVDEQRRLSSQFNHDCAGKSSESARRAAEALNNSQQAR
ncbi:hypothetical protein R2R70_05970 [Cobetia sp. SIMBA_158]|uniref:hypothetical protein n=1 Tax=Cobetia sp. SIMBA_158 TaxID=3081617 RepID=UPI00397F6F46